MAPEVESSNPFPDKPSSSSTEKSEAEAWLDSCLVFHHGNDAADNLGISLSRDSSLHPTEDLYTGLRSLISERLTEDLSPVSRRSISERFPYANPNDELATTWIRSFSESFLNLDANEDLSTMRTLLSLQNFPEENEEDENEISCVKRELPRENEQGEFRTLDLADDENPSSTLGPGAEDDLADIFRVWDLNTEDPELEKGTLTDILRSSLGESRSNDGSPDALGDLPAIPLEGGAGLSLKEVEKGMEEPESVESLIAALSDLNISVSRQNGLEDC